MGLAPTPPGRTPPPPSPGGAANEKGLGSGVAKGLGGGAPAHFSSATALSQYLQGYLAHKKQYTQGYLAHKKQYTQG